MVFLEQSLMAWKRDWQNWKSEELPSRPQHCWDQLKYSEESWRSEETCSHSDSIERPPPSDNGGARGVVVIVVGNGHGDTSSNPGRDWLHFT